MLRQRHNANEWLRQPFGVVAASVAVALGVFAWGCSLSQGRTSAPANVSASGTAAPDSEDWDSEEPSAAWGRAFEFNADASRYFGYPPMEVQFAASPLNGASPYAYTWDFGDGSPAVEGAEVVHTFLSVGRHTVYATGRDASGQEYRVQLLVDLVPKERWAAPRGLDPATLPPLAAPAAASR
jgi:PKD domain